MARNTRTPPASASRPWYRVTNWGYYNRALVARGSITLWTCEEVIAGWQATGGKGLRDSDVAMCAALSLRAVSTATAPSSRSMHSRSSGTCGFARSMLQKRCFCDRISSRIKSWPSSLPPRKGAAIRPPPDRPDGPTTRGAAVARIAKIGRKARTHETSYHRRSLAETATGRTKTIIGSGLTARSFDRQQVEAALAVRCINRSRYARERQDHLKPQGKGQTGIQTFHATTPFNC